MHLGERDCSVQRRYQKVIEESPSPAVDAALRERLGEAALRLVRASGYVNAGTAEFLLDRDGDFVFLEVNARLQVEHGVTELVTGLDLVAQQLLVASGQPLGFGQQDVRLDGHAVECRVYAEDPARGYLPSPGRLTHFAPPVGGGVRVDTGVETGSTVPPEYDALLAKVMAYGGTRTEAIERCRAALDAFAVEGVRTNLGLLAAVLRRPGFVGGEAGLDTLSALRPEDFVPVLPREVLVAAVLERLCERRTPDPWRAAGPWRVDGRAGVALRFQGRTFSVAAERLVGRPDAWRLELDGREAIEVRGRRGTGAALEVEQDGVSRTWSVVEDGGVILVRHAGGHEYAITLPPPEPRRRGAARAASGVLELRAPMAGAVVAIHVRSGDRVRAGQAVAVIEAMKMEHVVEAPGDGVVEDVRVALGQHVTEGDVLVALRPGAGGGGEVEHGNA